MLVSRDKQLQTKLGPWPSVMPCYCTATPQKNHVLTTRDHLKGSSSFLRSLTEVGHLNGHLMPTKRSGEMKGEIYSSTR